MLFVCYCRDFPLLLTLENNAAQQNLFFEIEIAMRICFDFQILRALHGTKREFKIIPFQILTPQSVMALISHPSLRVFYLLIYQWGRQ